MKKLVAIAMLILTVGLIHGQTFTVGNLKYMVDADIQGAVILTGTTAVSEPVTIPSTVTYGDVTYAVRSIAPNAFKQSSITGDLVIPESVRVIGERAFWECPGITGIVLPATVDSIGDLCFRDCASVKELYLGGSFKYAMLYQGGRYYVRAFYGLGKSAGELTVTIGKEVERVEKSLFSNIDVTSLIFEQGSRCRTIDDYAFSGVSLAGTLNLPETIDSIGSYAFSGTRFVELNMPAEIDTIGRNAFASIATLGKVNWNVNSKSSGSVFGGQLFEGSGSEEEGFELVLGDSVRSIPNTVFYSAGVKSITWPDNCRIERIGSSAFYGNVLLTGDITIPSSVRIVGDKAFAGCSSLTSVTLPHSIEQLGTSVFSNCSGLTSATLPHSIEQLGIGVFAGCKALERLVYDVPDVEGEIALFGKTVSEMFPTEIVIGPHVETIPTRILGSKRIPYKVCIAGATSLKTIKKEAFSESGSITFDSLMFPPTLESIGIRAFYDCGSIKADVRLPASLKSIGSYAFRGVTATSLYLGSDSVKDFGELIFAGPLIIEKTLRHVEEKLFERSTITSLTIEDGSMLESIGDRAFAEAKFTGELTLPQGLVSIGKAAFKNCDQFTLAGDLPESLTSVGDEAFYGCVGLNSPFPLPASLESVGDKAFYGCVGLSGTLTIPASVKSVGWDAFAGTLYTKLVVEAGAEPLQFGDNFNPTGNWIIRAPDRNRIESMSGISLPVGQFSTMEEVEINRDITYRGGLVMNMGIARLYYSPFNGATALSRVKLGPGVTTIQPYFLTSACIAEIEVGSLVPPVADKWSFSGCDYENCVLRLPMGAVNSYAAAEGWKNFFTNVDPNGAVNEIETDAPDATYFDLRGISVSRPNGRGIYIRRSPSGSSKLKL